MPAESWRGLALRWCRPDRGYESASWNEIRVRASVAGLAGRQLGQLPWRGGWSRTSSSWLNPTMAQEPFIVITTIGSLVRQGYHMGVSRWCCERGITLDAADFPAEMPRAT